MANSDLEQIPSHYFLQTTSGASLLAEINLTNNGITVWIRNYIPHETKGLITYPSIFSLNGDKLSLVYLFTEWYFSRKTTFKWWQYTTLVGKWSTDVSIRIYKRHNYGKIHCKISVNWFLFLLFIFKSMKKSFMEVTKGCIVIQIIVIHEQHNING